MAILGFAPTVPLFFDESDTISIPKRRRIPL
jgi:hypothetical protein